MSGINELNRLVCAATLDNGTPFPAGTPWFLSIISHGGIVGSQWWTEHVLPENASAHFRLQDWRGTIAHGNPWRENNVVAGWVPDGPNPNTQGISNRRLVNTPANWKEVCRRLYACLQLRHWLRCPELTAPSDRDSSQYAEEVYRTFIRADPLVQRSVYLVDATDTATFLSQILCLAEDLAKSGWR